MQTIKCPGCGHSLHVATMICQFCKTDVSQVPRPAPEKETKKGTYKPIPKSTMVGYYCMCGLYIALGSANILVGVGAFGSVGDFMKNIYVVLGSMTALVGLGGFFRLTAIYQVIGLICALQGVFGIVNIVAAVMTTEGAFRYSLISLNAVEVIAAGLMFYYGEETAIRAMSA